ncbi:PASTA domain-containing protein (plasmid) [Streptomyces sp. BI20]|uniref:PASTA domain-containing protein n=1 Tax=Streptomyces sp. BI20 TaxID=3403460 RepID=UPI003C782E04
MRTRHRAVTGALAALSTLALALGLTACNPALAGRLEAAPVPAAPVDGRVVVPDLLGTGLHSADARARAAGLSAPISEDALGRDRQRTPAAGWRVCAQNPGAGANVPVSSTILLSVVKADERCP